MAHAHLMICISRECVPAASKVSLHVTGRGVVTRITSQRTVPVSAAARISSSAHRQRHQWSPPSHTILLTSSPSPPSLTLSHRTTQTSCRRLPVEIVPRWPLRRKRRTSDLSQWMVRRSGGLFPDVRCPDRRMWVSDIIAVLLSTTSEASNARKEASGMKKYPAFKKRWWTCSSSFRTTRSQSVTLVQTFLKDKTCTTVKASLLLTSAQVSFSPMHSEWPYSLVWLQSAVADDGHLILFNVPLCHELFYPFRRQQTFLSFGFSLFYFFVWVMWCHSNAWVW